MSALPLAGASSHQAGEEFVKPVLINTMPVDDFTKQGIELTKSEQFTERMILERCFSPDHPLGYGLNGSVCVKRSRNLSKLDRFSD